MEEKIIQKQTRHIPTASDDLVLVDDELYEHEKLIHS